MTPTEAADALYAVIPRGLSREFLLDYGIEGTDEEAREVTREVLSLNLYWVSAAIEAHLARQYRTVVFEQVLRLVRQDWASQYQQTHVPWPDYMREWEERLNTYAPLGKEQGGELAVTTQAGIILADNRIVREDDRAKVLALLMDLVPLDRYGAILDERA